MTDVTTRCDRRHAEPWAAGIVSRAGLVVTNSFVLIADKVPVSPKNE